MVAIAYHDNVLGCGSTKLFESIGDYFCLVGALADGHDYALDAYSRGCRVFVCERMPSGFPKRGTKIIIAKQGTRAALSDVAAEFYGHPENALKLVGITGTKGKTTTAELACLILNKNGIKAGYIGTNGVKFDTHKFTTVNTTPESCDLYEYLSMMLETKVKIAVIEVSSQALMTGRVRGIKFDTAVFTNLYHDHIGGAEHPTFENYKEWKEAAKACDYALSYITFNKSDVEALLSKNGNDPKKIQAAFLRKLEKEAAAVEKEKAEAEDLVQKLSFWNLCEAFLDATLFPSPKPRPSTAHSPSCGNLDPDFALSDSPLHCGTNS